MRHLMLAVFIAVVPMKIIAQDSNLVVQTFVKEHIMPRFVILKTFTKIWQKLPKLTYTMQVGRWLRRFLWHKRAVTCVWSTPDAPHQYNADVGQSSGNDLKALPFYLLPNCCSSTVVTRRFTATFPL
jgi:hypothetical protein